MSTDRNVVENTEQDEYWNGEPGRSWVLLEDDFRQAISGYLNPPIDGAAIQHGDRVLDVGCGGGDTTILAATTSETGVALGLDLSLPLLERARKKAAESSVSNIEFEVGDAQSYSFAPGAFDCAISRFGVMFFAKPERAFANIRSAMAPVGRLSMVVWQPLSENEWLEGVRSAVALGRELPVPRVGEPGPFGLSDPAFTRTVLEGAGWSNVEFQALRRPYKAGGTVDAAVAFLHRQSVTRGLLEDLDAPAREYAQANLRALVESRLTDQGVIFQSAAWLVTARNRA